MPAVLLFLGHVPTDYAAEAHLKISRVRLILSGTSERVQSRLQLRRGCAPMLLQPSQKISTHSSERPRTTRGEQDLASLRPLRLGPTPRASTASLCFASTFLNPASESARRIDDKRF